MPAYKKMPDAMRKCMGPECDGCGASDCYAKGGEVDDPLKKRIEDNKKTLDLSDAASSAEGKRIALNHDDGPAYAKGGPVDADGDHDDDGMDDLKHAMGGEFMDAMERKDRKGIMSALEAIVLSCRGKE